MNNLDYTNYCSETYGYISDASKDAQGFRTRFDHTMFTLVQLLMMADDWSYQVGIAIDEEKERQDANVVEFEALIVRTIDMGAGDRETAVRWLLADLDMGMGSFGYEYDIDYSYNPFTGDRDDWGWERRYATAA